MKSKLIIPIILLVMITPAFADFDCTLENGTMTCPTPEVICGVQSDQACQWERDWYRTQFESCVNETSDIEYDFSSCDGISNIDVRTEEMKEDIDGLQGVFGNVSNDLRHTIEQSLATQNVNSMNCDGMRVTCTQYSNNMGNRNMYIVGAFVAGLAAMYFYITEFKRGEIKEDEIHRELPRFG